MDAYLDNCLSINENDDGYKEKTRIAEVAAATLCRLNSIMRQMKDWRDDRVKLRSNIWRLKLALRVAGKETTDTLHADPLIEHQRGEIKRLEADNQALKKEIADIKAAIVDADYISDETAYKSDEKFSEVKQEYLMEREYLNNEILYLKSRLKEVEDGHEHDTEVEHLKCKLKHFMMVDHTMEIIFTDIVNKVAETIANLSEELVNTNEHLNRSKLKNNRLYVKVDRLNAMLRSRSGNIVDYQKRIVELNNLTKCLKTELGKLKTNFEHDSWSADSTPEGNLDNVERLTNDLKNKLKNDYAALLGAGDLNCWKYFQTIFELRVNLKQLHVQLTKLKADFSSRYENLVESSKHMKQLSAVESTLKDINIEFDRLKDEHVRKYCRIGGADGIQYLRKIEDLQTIIEQIRRTINELNHRTKFNSDEGKEIVKLDDFVGRVCQEIKQLEVIVISSDRSALLKKIEHLEESIVRLKVELSEKAERVNTLATELFNVETLTEERTKEATDAKRKVDVLTEENKILKTKIRDMEEKALELEREHEDVRKEFEQLQQVKHDTNITKKKLQNIRTEKEKLLKENEELCDALEKRNEKINVMATEKLSVEKALKTRITDLTKNFQTASKENERLQNKVNELEQLRSKQHSQEMSENTENELLRLRSSLQASKEARDIAGREIAELKARLDHFSNDRAKLEMDVCHLESKKEILVYELGVEKAIAEERLVELTKLKSDYNRLNNERIDLKKEKERLNVDLSILAATKEQLEKSVENVEIRCSKLEDETDKYRSECSVLREEVKSFKTGKENLAIKLEKAEAELNEGEYKIRRLEFEISKLQDNLNDLSLKNISLEDRVQVLLTEKNDLVTRINELDGKNVELKDQLNKVKTENEYSSVELNKLRAECDRAKSENASLQNMLDESNRSNQVLKKMSEELKLKLNEVYSECRILENQLKILEIGNTALKREKEALQHEYMNSLRLNIPEIQNADSKADSEKILDECDEQDVDRSGKKIVNETKKSNKKSDKRTNGKMKSKEELKRALVENEALKFEIMNLREQNFEVKMEMSRTKDELQRQKSKSMNDNNVSNKLEIVNLYYKEINSYSGQQFGKMDTLAHINQSGVCPFIGSTIDLQSGTEIDKLLEVINKLQIENVALKMEVNTLRCSFVMNVTEDEKRWNKLRNTREEIGALKVELTKLRDEKESLQNRLDAVRTKLDQAESEKTALKNELYALRKTNSDFMRKADELQCDYQKLKGIREGLDSCIMESIKKIKKYTTSGNVEEIDEQLKVFLESYILNGKFIQLIKE
ncbi:uncharacterized protein LOC105662009 [Megachile rotundata]|uniref:uncharacterized protein LOC105662009 n=1 Tax=Megachile rotundata TaxID=143995 RepID=UPI000614BEE1|nr:PREDICTED: uncharacterized protein PFB0765w-like [Megachile rotundata]